jgi:diadenosine tetraphosphate (Ap4A) HIT family hydrolase
MAEASCLTCELMRRRDRGEAPVWDSILRTEHWDLVHSFDTSLLGWLVLIARRHIEALAELTDAEAASLGLLVRDVSQALQRALACQKTYVVQFAEAKEHPHVHVHVIARMPDLPNEARGPGVFRYLGRPKTERVPESDRDRLAQQLRALLIGP